MAIGGDERWSSSAVRDKISRSSSSSFSSCGNCAAKGAPCVGFSATLYSYPTVVVRIRGSHRSNVPSLPYEIVIQ